MDTEKLLAGLLDYQRFAREPTLQRLIEDTETRCFGEELSDDVLRTLSAAGDPYSKAPDPRKPPF